MSTVAKVPHVVIVGAGFGGLMAAKGLAKAPVQITVIDKANYHLFQPLLYQIATATLSPADIAQPIRSILHHQSNTEVLMAEVQGVDLRTSEVKLADRSVPFDYLVLATGATHSYFGHDEWEKFAPGLKSISDATQIRTKILTAFEKAEMESDPAKRQELLTFVLVGGGPTGVEMAGAIAELSHRALAADFRRVDPKSARIILVEAGPRLLAAFPPDLSQKARESLERLGVEIRVGSRVEKVEEDGVWIAGGKVPARTTIWAAGVVASPAGKWLGVETDRAGRVPVEPDLSAKGHANIFVLGDACTLADAKGKPLPGVAPVAIQQGRYAAKVILARLRGTTPPPFRYVDKGNLATIGRSSAVADIRGWHLSGFPAWVTWMAVHIYFLIGFRNRLVVMIQWAWAYIAFARGARLIVPRILPALSFLM